jgi:hypothetical protein
MCSRAGQPTLCVVNVTPLRKDHPGTYVTATFRNVRELNPHTLASVLKEEPFCSDISLSHLAYGISELDRSLTTSTWIYLSAAAAKLLCGFGRSGLCALLQQEARAWWVSEMLSLEISGGFVRLNHDRARFPGLPESSVSLKRVADGDTGLPRFFWLLDENDIHPEVSEAHS